MSRQNFVVLGCGPAGLSAVEAIKKRLPDAGITVISREALPPYSPALLAYVVGKRVPPERCWLRSIDQLEDLGVQFLSGRTALELRPSRAEVSLDDGRVVSYDKLLIATGADAAGVENDGVEGRMLVLRTFADAENLDRALSTRAKSVAVYGGGLVAVETAMALIERGASVEMIVRSRLLRGYFEERIGNRVSQALEAKGCRIHQNTKVLEVEREADGTVLSLSNGSVPRYDLAVSCLGTTARHQLAVNAGIEVSEGICVNRHMETSAPNVFAAGDVAEAEDFFSGFRARSSILPTALRQGEIAGANMAGEELEYEGWIPMNTVNVFGVTVASIGDLSSAGPEYEALERVSEDGGRIRKFVYRGNVLTGGVFMNADVDIGSVRYLIENRVSLSQHKQALLDGPNGIESALVEQYMETRNG